jgi:hypothetical protein
MNGLRKAALYLHGLEDVDRRWLLNALSDDERDNLLATLTELDEMGVPSGKAWLPELAETHITEAREEENAPHSSEIEAIEGADLEKLIHAFEQEPESIVALLLKHRVWSWRQAYLGKQYLQKREQLLRAFETPSPPLKPKVEAALLTALASQLNKAESTSGKDFEASLVDAQRDQLNNEQPSIWRRLWRR